MYDSPLMQEENMKISYDWEYAGAVATVQPGPDASPAVRQGRDGGATHLLQHCQADTLSHKVHIYHIVCPSSELGPPSPTSFPASECAPLKQGGAHLPVSGGEGGGVQIGRLKKKPRTLPLCALSSTLTTGRT